LNEEIKIGSIVTPCKEGIYLRSGGEAWVGAIVCSIDPFIMVSEDTTMRWSCEKIENYCVVSTGTDEQLQKCMRRLEPNERPVNFVMESVKVKSLYNLFDIVRHTKSEHNYIVTGTPEFNQLTSPRSPAYTYRREDGSDAVTYIRPKEAMEDGRFVLVKEYVPSPLKLTGTASSIVILNELG
jgi:hypothetical protein